jgi:hypothetical protein
VRHRGCLRLLRPAHSMLRVAHCSLLCPGVAAQQLARPPSIPSSPRCRPLCSAIYKYALDHLPKSQAGELYRRFVQFEKQLGDREGIEVRGPAFKRWS